MALVSFAHFLNDASRLLQLGTELLDQIVLGDELFLGRIPARLMLLTNSNAFSQAKVLALKELDVTLESMQLVLHHVRLALSLELNHLELLLQLGDLVLVLIGLLSVLKSLQLKRFLVLLRGLGAGEDALLDLQALLLKHVDCARAAVLRHRILLRRQGADHAHQTCIFVGVGVTICLVCLLGVLLLLRAHRHLITPTCDLLDLTGHQVKFGLQAVGNLFHRLVLDRLVQKQRTRTAVVGRQRLLLPYLMMMLLGLPELRLLAILDY